MPRSRAGPGPCPHGSCLPGRWTSRQSGLVRAGGLQGEHCSRQQLLKGLFVVKGLATGSCQARGTDSSAFVPACCPCPDPRGQQERGPYLWEAGELLPWVGPRAGMGVVCVTRQGPSSALLTDLAWKQSPDLARLAMGTIWRMKWLVVALMVRIG